jgi:hypothetical protein
MKAVMATAMAMALAGCAVVSEGPLFKAGDAAAVQLAQGRWALHGPGCDVTPGQDLPKCALPLEVRGDRIAGDAAGASGLMGGFGHPADGANPAAPSEFLLVEGDPQVMQLRQLPPSGAATASPKPPVASPKLPDTSDRRSYLAFRPTHRNAEGLSDRGVLWLIFCPDNIAKTPGFKVVAPQGGCEATTREAVLTQAKTVPPIFSFFMTWVGASPAAAPR